MTTLLHSTDQCSLNDYEQIGEETETDRPTYIPTDRQTDRQTH